MILSEVLAPGNIHLDSYTSTVQAYVPHIGETICCLTNFLRLTKDDRWFTGTKRIVRIIWRIDQFFFTTLPAPRFRIARRRSKNPEPGLGILATCQQMYEDGHLLLYTHNRFHLAPGPVGFATHYFRKLQAHHRSLIQSLVMSFTLADLTPAGFLWVTHVMGLRYPHWRKYPTAWQTAAWECVAMDVLWFFWQQKLDWVVAHLDGLQEITLVGGGWALRLAGAGHRVKEELRRVRCPDRNAAEREFLHLCFHAAKPALRKLLEAGSVDQVRDRLDRLGQRSRLAPRRVGVVNRFGEWWRGEGGLC